MTNIKVKQIVLASRPKGSPTKDNFRFEDVSLKALENGEVLLKPLFISVDPYMRGRMSDAKSYTPSFAIDAPIVGGTVALVEESRNPKLKKGDKVVGALPWATLSIANAEELHKIDESLSVPASYYLGILGMPGQTAYFGLTDICKPKKGETVVVSGAAGAVGIIVGQIAKIKGARVVGIAGSDDKLKMLKDEFNFDEVINYKTADMKSAIEKACPSGVDCYYDNVGGEITDVVISNFNRYARMAVCGQISLYNQIEMPLGPRILPAILKTSALVKGFIVNDYQERFAESTRDMIKWVKDGKLTHKETIIDGFEQLPNAFLGLFDGSNTGKMVVKI